MRFHATMKWFAALAVLGLAPAPADAQQGSYAPPPSSVGQSGSVAATPGDMAGAAQGYLQTAKTTRATVANDLQQARSSHDVVLVLCLNDVLNQLDAAISTMQARIANLTSAANPEDASHEYTILQVMNDRVKQLASAANACVGATNTSMEASVQTSIDPGLAFGDMTPPPWDTEPWPSPTPPGIPNIPAPPPLPCSPQK